MSLLLSLRLGVSKDKCLPQRQLWVYRLTLLKRETVTAVSRLLSGQACWHTPQRKHRETGEEGVCLHLQSGWSHCRWINITLAWAVDVLPVIYLYIEQQFLKQTWKQSKIHLQRSVSFKDTKLNIERSTVPRSSHRRNKSFTNIFHSVAGCNSIISNIVVHKIWSVNGSNGQIYCTSITHSSPDWTTTFSETVGFVVLWQWKL